MDDPGNLIYLAFLVISLIAGLLRNRNKSAGRETKSGHPESKPIINVEDFRDIIEQRKVREKAAEERLRQMEAEALRAKEKKTKLQTPRKRITEPVMDEETAHAEENDLTQIDLRKAVIYSEILNPPYV